MQTVCATICLITGWNELIYRRRRRFSPHCVVTNAQLFWFWLQTHGCITIDTEFYDKTWLDKPQFWNAVEQSYPSNHKMAMLSYIFLPLHSKSGLWQNETFSCLARQWAGLIIWVTAKIETYVGVYLLHNFLKLQQMIKKHVTCDMKQSFHRVLQTLVFLEL